MNEYSIIDIACTQSKIGYINTHTYTNVLNKSIAFVYVHIQVKNKVENSRHDWWKFAIEKIGLAKSFGSMRSLFSFVTQRPVTIQGTYSIAVLV